MLPAPVNSEPDTDLTSLNWLHSLTNILSVPSLPTPPDSPNSPVRSADQNPKKLPHKIRFQMSECCRGYYIAIEFFGNFDLSISHSRFGKCRTIQKEWRQKATFLILYIDLYGYES